ncbi:6-phosphogluconate dehydrogenase, decarboxylating [Sulfitobacter guttiformis KCTC 32187]|nr:6-phosphogluconate dehydrogenase, decarboxylating [Sulfitobacter guttiformis KCTC 32187]
MDAMIEAALPSPEGGDTIIDDGNADFNDTRRRSVQIAGSGLHFVGMGVSGGETGARAALSTLAC